MTGLRASCSFQKPRSRFFNLDMAKTTPKRHIRHSPNTGLVLKVQQETEFLVKSSTPFIAAVKRISKKLEKFDKSNVSHKKYQRGEYLKVKYICVKGMGRAIEKTISIGLMFKNDMNYHVEITTGGTLVLDEFRPQDSDEENDDEITFQKRMVCYVEVRIFLKRA